MGVLARRIGRCAALALALCSCSTGGGDGATTSTASDPGTPAPTAATPIDCALGDGGERTIDVDGVERAYDLHLPDDLADLAEPAPVLVLFHGYTSSKEQVASYTGLGTSAPARGVVLVVPQGLGDPSTWGVLEGLVEDEAFVNGVLDEVLASPCVDPTAVWLTGHSAGSAFSGVFGCRNADRIAGLGLNAGLPPAICKEGTTPDVLITNGTDDAIVPFEGGAQTVGSAQIPLEAIPDSAAGWAVRAGCDAEPAVTEPLDDLSLTTWSGCVHGEVVLQAIDGGGHSWPGAVDLPRPRQATQTFDGSCVLLDRITAFEGDTYEHCAGPIDGSTT